MNGLISWIFIIGAFGSVNAAAYSSADCEKQVDALEFNRIQYHSVFNRVTLDDTEVAADGGFRYNPTGYQDGPGPAYWDRINTNIQREPTGRLQETIYELRIENLSPEVITTEVAWYLTDDITNAHPLLVLRIDAQPETTRIYCSTMNSAFATNGATTIQMRPKNQG